MAFNASNFLNLIFTQVLPPFAESEELSLMIGLCPLLGKALVKWKSWVQNPTSELLTLQNGCIGGVYESW